MPEAPRTAGAVLARIRPLAVPAGIFLASRLVTLAVAHAARLVSPQPLAALLSRWDGAHYLGIAASGYPATLPSGTGAAAQSPHVFFPGYPLLVRLVDSATGLAPVPAALVVNIGLATVAAVLIWVLARDLLGEEAATRTVALVSFFPGAFVLGMAYSEGTFLALAAGCLLALHRRWWVPAGLAAAAAGATRPTGLALTLCCAWAAVGAVRARREWAALLAPALAPLGFVAWSAFLEGRTGSATAWVTGQERGWGQRLDFGAATARSVWRFLGAPLADFNRTVSVLTLVALAAGLVLLARWRPPGTLVVYTAATVAPVVTSAVVASTPRYVLIAFPLHMALARALTGTAFAVTLALSAAAMAVLMLVAELSLALTP